MDIVESLKLKIQKALASLGKEVALNDIVIETSKDTAHGDYATNAAMKLCRLFGAAPRDVANQIIGAIDMEGIEKIGKEIDWNGLIDVFMKDKGKSNGN